MKPLLILIATCGIALGGVDKGEGCPSIRVEICNVTVGETIPLQEGWRIGAAADFNLDGYPDLLLVNDTTGETVIWFLQPQQQKARNGSTGN